jgi:RNase P subunit RPR2
MRLEYSRRIEAHWGDTVMAQAYCMKCGKKVEVKDAKQVTLANGRPAVTGTCSACGTKVFRIGTA